jgi:hypothetical protein
VSGDGSKREVKGEGKNGSLTNGSKIVDSDGDISTAPLERDMDLDELMRQKVNLFKIGWKLNE